MIGNPLKLSPDFPPLHTVHEDVYKRQILYTTNAVESVNASFRKVTKKGAFPNENALLKLLYLKMCIRDRIKYNIS